MICILKRCAWHGRNCHVLGECGASYALSRASEPGGYEVLSWENLTIEGLIDAGLVEATRTNNGTLIVKAVSSGRTERAA